MKMYHASFRGQNRREFGALFDHVVILMAESIYDVKGLLEKRYSFIRGLCVTDCEACGLDFIEVK